MHTTKLYEEKITCIDNTIEALKQEKAELQQNAKKSEVSKGIESWVGFHFESSSGLTEEFASFAKDFKKYLLQQVKNDFDLVRWSRGHFEVYGHLKHKKTGQFIYFSISDVRYFADSWYNSVLIRTAKHEKDYTGGSNNSCNFNAIAIQAIALLN